MKFMKLELGGAEMCEPKDTQHPEIQEDGYGPWSEW
jgi:hypothetical protein